MHSTTTPLVKRILVLGKGNSASLPYLLIILICLSVICALKEFTAAVAEPVTKKSLTAVAEPVTKKSLSNWEYLIVQRDT